MLTTHLEIVESIGRLVGEGDPTRVAAQVVTAKRNDTAVEQIVGRLSLEPHIGAVAWQLDRTIPEGGAACLDRSDCALDPMTLAAEGPSRRSEPFRA